MRPEINNQSKNIEDPSNKGTDISFQNTGTKKPEPSILQDKRLYPFFAATAISIGSVLVKDKNGISYAQKLFDSIVEKPHGVSFEIKPNRSETFSGAFLAFIVPYVTITALSVAANKLYNSTISTGSDEKHK